MVVHTCLLPWSILVARMLSGRSHTVSLQAQGVMWALKGSLAKEPLMTEVFLSSCMAALKPVQIAQLIVAYFPRTVWPDLVAICSAVIPRNGRLAANGAHA